ncbi:MAG: hypothetical protein WBA28_04990 [Microbacteriaceae bacterium]
MAHTIRLTIEVVLERSQGKFASRDEMTEALIDEIEQSDPGTLYGLGADGESEYEIVEWNVEEA